MRFIAIKTNRTEVRDQLQWSVVDRHYIVANDKKNSRCESYITYKQIQGGEITPGSVINGLLRMPNLSTIRVYMTW